MPWSNKCDDCGKDVDPWTFLGCDCAKSKSATFEWNLTRQCCGRFPDKYTDYSSGPLIFQSWMFRCPVCGKNTGYKSPMKALENWDGEVVSES